ncbi:MAG TPA: RpiB/LacA/LacB family sugar-phosphate isomerase [Acidimicrobiales bacterium]|nr:RpiB/LacA/LacB family sugar-phosphate isomerase [Acidimicrobiales bacterium]
MRIALGSDEETPLVEHIARHLRAAGHSVERLAPGAAWPEVGRTVARAVVRGDADRGIVCCYTGTGVAIAANKVPGARAALCGDAATALGARRWNDANVLALSLRLTSEALASEVVDAFLEGEPDPAEAEAIARVEPAQ